MFKSLKKKLVVLLGMSLVLGTLFISVGSVPAFACTAVASTCPHQLYDMIPSGTPWTKDTVDVYYDPWFDNHTGWDARATSARSTLNGVVGSDPTQLFGGYWQSWQFVDTCAGFEAWIGTSSPYDYIILRDDYNYLSSSTFAATLSCDFSGNGVKDHAITYLNTYDHNFNALSGEDATKLDLQGVLLHEAMHALSWAGHWGDNNHPVASGMCSGSDILTMCTNPTNSETYDFRTLQHDDTEEWKDSY